MGCAPSVTSCKGGGIRLMATKLTFTRDQLDNLNAYFLKCVESTAVSPDVTRIEATVERLVQRLIAGVANLDHRFSSMFLVSLNDRRRVEQLKFEYLMRLDVLSTPIVLQDDATPICVEEDSGMPGFARLRICSGSSTETWAEFLGPGGRLRRDLVKARLANLLAAATKPEAARGVDERICSSPGQVVDPEVLDKILKQPDHCRIFYGPASAESTPPEPRDHRVAIVEDAGGILLRIGLSGGGKVREVEVRLLIGAAISSWSNLADYPRRVPLHHCDALLHYTAAQSGMYLVAVGPHPGVRCEDRATLWRVRFPAAESMLSQHYSEDSVPALTEAVLMEILDRLRGRQRRRMDLPMKSKDTPRVISRYILRTIHLWALERAGPDPLGNWAPETLSRHVLLALDELITALRCQSLRCYFYPRCNVMLQCAKGGILHHEDSYMSDSRLLEDYLVVLHRHSSGMAHGEPLPADVLETELIARWRRVVTSLPRGTMGGHHGYNARQLEYLGLVVREVLRVKDVTLQGFDRGAFPGFPTTAHASEPTENLVHLLGLVLKQARDQIYATTSRRSRRRDRRQSLRRRMKGNASAYFERSLDVLVDVVRRDRETAYMDLDSHVVMARTLLRWLYFGMEHDKKILGPILRPYLGNLFNSSHENAWHVESWRKRQEIYTSEMRSLALFCKLVTAQEESPADGIVESLSKGWSWAEEVARMIERSEGGLRLVFLAPTRTAKYNLTFANDRGFDAFDTWSKARNIGHAVKRATIARTNMITATGVLPGLKGGTATAAASARGNVNRGFAGHVALRDASPLTYVASMARRRGRQRGPGGLIPALVALNKFRILQEVAAVLPQEERVAMLDAVRRVAREASRRLRRASCPETSDSTSPRQTYTPRSESNLLDSPPRLSPTTRQRRIIAEHQKQLHREMMEMRDTLTRGLRSMSRLPAWDASSLASWTSSLGSAGRSRLRKNRVPAWDIARGSSAMWDSVSSDGSFSRSRSEEMASREESPDWNTSEFRRARGGSRAREMDEDAGGDLDSKERDRLPSWDHLEATLDRKLSRYDSVEPDSLEINRDVGIDYLLMSNARKEVLEENRGASSPWKTPLLKQGRDMGLRLTLPKDKVVPSPRDGHRLQAEREKP